MYAFKLDILQINYFLLNNLFLSGKMFPNTQINQRGITIRGKNINKFI